MRERAERLAERVAQMRRDPRALFMPVEVRQLVTEIEIFLREFTKDGAAITKTNRESVGNG